MISQITVISFGILVVFSVALPILTYMLLKGREKGDVKIYLYGVLAFFLGSYLFKTPILQTLNAQGLLTNMMETNFILYAILVSFLSGFFEIIAIFLLVRFLLKNKINWKTGYLVGAGYAGIEVILMLGLSYVTYLSYAMSINDGTLFNMIGQNGVTAEMVNGVVTQLQSFEFMFVFINIFEHVSLLAVHIGLSIFVIEGIMNGKYWIHILLAVLFRGSMDVFNIVIRNSMGMLFAEIIIGAFAAVSVYYIIQSRKRLAGQQVEVI